MSSGFLQNADVGRRHRLLELGGSKSAPGRSQWVRNAATAQLACDTYCTRYKKLCILSSVLPDIVESINIYTEKKSVSSEYPGSLRNGIVAIEYKRYHLIVSWLGTLFNFLSFFNCIFSESKAVLCEYFILWSSMPTVLLSAL